MNILDSLIHLKLLLFIPCLFRIYCSKCWSEYFFSTSSLTAGFGSITQSSKCSQILFWCHFIPWPFCCHCLICRADSTTTSPAVISLTGKKYNDWRSRKLCVIACVHTSITNCTWPCDSLLTRLEWQISELITLLHFYMFIIIHPSSMKFVDKMYLEGKKGWVFLLLNVLEISAFKRRKLKKLTNQELF